MTDQTSALTPTERLGLTIEATPAKSPNPTSSKVVPSEQDRSADRPDRSEPQTSQPLEINDFDHDVDFFPMFFASAQAALLTLGANLVLSVFLALQFGAGLELRFFARVLPYLILETDLRTFQRVVLWATVLTAALLIIFSVAAFFTNQSLRVRAGRAFAWLDVALLGAMQLYRQYYLDGLGVAERWMWALVLVGIVGFAVCSYIIWLDAQDKEAELLAQKPRLAVGSVPAAP